MCILNRSIVFIGYYIKKYLYKLLIICYWTMHIGIHNTKVNFCDCRKDAITLVRHNLFPASPKLPVTAFHFTFLEFFALLQAEGYLAVQAFAAASATAHKYQVDTFQIAFNS